VVPKAVTPAPAKPAGKAEKPKGKWFD
jgi:hypothetical protein